jgi:hypothetical protein
MAAECREQHAADRGRDEAAATVEVDWGRALPWVMEERGYAAAAATAG